MRTTKPFSTISYNSEAFLVAQLNELMKSHLISFWAFIRHFPEADESKSHIHLIMFPSQRIDTDKIAECLQEYDPEHPDKPFGIMPCRSSKFADWFLYCIHDESYLALKVLSRHYHYRETDIVSSNFDYLMELAHTFDRRKYQGASVFIDLIRQGNSFSYLIEKGIVPAPLVNQYKTIYEIVMAEMEGDDLRRNGRPTHTPIVNNTTGEVTESEVHYSVKIED